MEFLFFNFQMWNLQTWSIDFLVSLGLKCFSWHEGNSLPPHDRQDGKWLAFVTVIIVQNIWDGNGCWEHKPPPSGTQGLTTPVCDLHEPEQHHQVSRFVKFISLKLWKKVEFSNEKVVGYKIDGLPHSGFEKFVI